MKTVPTVNTRPPPSSLALDPAADPVSCPLHPLFWRPDALPRCHPESGASLPTPYRTALPQVAQVLC